MQHRLLSVILIVFLSAGSAVDDDPLHPEVDVIHYKFELSLDDVSDVIRGEASVTAQFLAEGKKTFMLDLVGKTRAGTGMVVQKVVSDHHPVRFEHRSDELQLFFDTPAQVGEEKTFIVSYEGVPADGLIISENKFGDRTFFGDNWPDRARHWLPVIDHPSDKATSEFIVTAPDHYETVSNGTLVSYKDLPGPLEVTHWSSTAPLPTKVMVIGVADFSITSSDELSGVPVQTWVFPQDSIRGTYDFALAKPILNFFQERIGPFPYEKLANVQSKTRYGGMENAGAIFYAEDAVTGDRSSESLLAHEIAHQWFGDAVTEKDWSHIWLSEGFATYFTNLYLESRYGRDKIVPRLKASRSNVISYHRLDPDSPLVDNSFTDPNELLNPNSYDKGAWVLHMLRYVAGDDVFWEGIRRYYEQFKHSNAATADFQHIMEEVSGRDLSWFFQQWVYSPGYPQLRGSWDYDETTQKLTIHLEQVQRGDAVFRLPLEVAILDHPSAEPIVKKLEVEKKNEVFVFDMDRSPVAVVLDPNTWVLMETSLKPQKN